MNRFKLIDTLLEFMPIGVVALVVVVFCVGLVAHVNGRENAWHAACISMTGDETKCKILWNLR